MNNRFSILNVIKLAGAYIAFSIGSGFATGQEVMQFFTAFGFSGIIGALVSMLLFAGLGAILMAKGYDLKLKTQTTAFRYYCGKYVGICLEIFTVVFLLCVVSIMIAGMVSALDSLSSIKDSQFVVAFDPCAFFAM